MRTSALVRLVAAAALAAVACGPIAHSSNASAGRTTAGVTASAARNEIPCPTVQPASQFAASGQSNRNLAIVWLKGSPTFVVEDLTDIFHPISVSTFDNLWSLQFVSASELFYEGGGATDLGQLMRMPLSGSPKSVVATCVRWAAWSPDGRSAAYFSNGEAADLHLIRGGENQVVGSTGFWGATGCEFRMCAERWNSMFGYSPSGAHVALVGNFPPRAFRIWTSDGKLQKSFDSVSGNDYMAGPSMAVWSGANLYWRDASGVEVWREGVQSLLLPRLSWIHPSASPAGGQIAFHTRDALGIAHISLLDTSSGKTRELKSSRSDPRFVNSNLIWYREEAPCVTGGPCDPESTTHATGKTFIYDLLSGMETESSIAEIFDVWPHAA